MTIKGLITKGSGMCLFCAAHPRLRSLSLELPPSKCASLREDVSRDQEHAFAPLVPAARRPRKRSKLSIPKAPSMLAKTELVKVARIGDTQEFGVFPESFSEYRSAKARTISTRSVCEAERDRINDIRSGKSEWSEDVSHAQYYSALSEVHQKQEQHSANSTQPITVGEMQRFEPHCDYTEEHVAEMFAKGGNHCVSGFRLAEVVRCPGLVDDLQSTFHVCLAGPTTFAAFLASLQMGFRTLAIQKKGSEVWRLLAATRL